MTIQTVGVSEAGIELERLQNLNEENEIKGPRLVLLIGVILIGYGSD